MRSGSANSHETVLGNMLFWISSGEMEISGRCSESDIKVLGSRHLEQNLRDSLHDRSTFKPPHCHVGKSPSLLKSVS